MIKHGFFRQDIEWVFKIGVVTVAFSVFLGAFAWGYEQRRQAQTWRDLACTYRLADLGRRATFLAVDEQTPAACSRLMELGISVQGAGVAAVSESPDTARP
jgi:carbonic anhydrase